MFCLDCSIDDRTTPAIGVCTTCGAGVCSSHLELDTHVIRPFAGVGATREYPTRAVTCAACAPVMTALHHSRYGGEVPVASASRDKSRA